MTPRNFRPGIPALLGALVLGGVIPYQLPAADPVPPTKSEAAWPLFRGGPRQTGVASSSLPAQLEVLWKFKAKDSIEGTAAIVDGVVYVGSLDEHLYALKLADGSLKWSYKGGPFKAPPSYHEGAIYLGDEDGLFHSVDAASGKKRWTFETGGGIAGGANFDAGKVLFGSEDEQLYCLSTEGKLQWKFKVAGGPVLASPAVVGNRTFVAGCDSTLHVIDTLTGKELASVDIGGQTGASSAVSGDNLYVGTMNNQVLGIDWKKAKLIWTFEAARRAQPFFASVAVTDKWVIAGSRDKLVHALDRKNGQEVWSYATRGKVDGSPVVVGKRVFVGSQDGNLYELDLEKGTLLKKFELGREIVASPAVAEGRLVIGNRDGNVYCLGEKTP